MKKLFYIFFISILFMDVIYCKAQTASSKYLGQKSPSITPEVFAPNLISTKEEYEFGSVFNKDGTAFFYGVNVNGKEEIRYCELIGKKWSTPKTILSHENYGFNDPFLSPDEKRLYFISRMAKDGKRDLSDYDIWYVERTSNGWSAPKNAGANINSDGNEYYISFTNSGTMYFSSNKNGSSFDIYTSQYKDGTFQTAVPMNDSINTSHYEADVFVDPNEEYVIFCATRPDGMGEGDLYISFRKKNGTWTKSKNMGEVINTPNHELCPFVSKDGKYFFYTSNRDIYWVDAKIIDKLRKEK